MTKVPQYFEYFNWYDLDNPLGIHDFIQEMKDNGVSIEDFPDIHIYYDIMYNNAFRDEPNMITVDYIVPKIKRALIRYGLAHTCKKVEYKLYYFWYDKEV